MNHRMKRILNGSGKLALTAILAGLVALSGANAAFANPFKKVSGNWRSAGATAVINGNKERIKCRASYTTPGRTLIMNLKCSGPGYFINVSVDARVIGSKVKGSWREAQFSKSGWISGRATKSRSNLAFGGGVKGSMSVRLNSRSRHSIYIRSGGNRVSIPMRR